MLVMHGVSPRHTLPMIEIERKLISAQIAVLNTRIIDRQMIFLNIQQQKPTFATGKTKINVNFDDALVSLAQKILVDLLFSNNPNFVVDQLIKKLTSTDENTNIINIPKLRRIIKLWITHGILRSIQNRNNMQKKLRADQQNEILRSTYKRYRNFCNKLIKKIKHKQDRGNLGW